MDKKDSIIMQQLEVIRSMTENSLRRMDNDFWGTPFANIGKTSDGTSIPEQGEKKDQPPTADGKDKEPEVREEDFPPENIDDLTACTMCDPAAFWSHRTMGLRRGSQANIIMLV